MNFPNDTSTQTITTLAVVSGSYNGFATLSDLSTTSNTLKGFIDGKQSTLTSATTLLGVGTAITAIDYNKITVNKPTNFQSDWNSTIINKPSVFPPDTTNLYTKTQTDTLLSAKENTLTFSTPLTRTTNTISIDLSSYLTSAIAATTYLTQTNANTFYQSNLTFNTPMSKTGNVVSIDLSSYLTSATAGTTYLTQTNASTYYQSNLTFNTPMSKTGNVVSIDLSSYLTSATASSTYLTQANASSTYLTQTSASSTYLTQANASSTYLTQTSASSTYLTQANASSTYLTQTNATNTYLKLDGSSTMTGKVYQNFTNIGTPSIGGTGGLGDRLILYAGSGTVHPYSLGIAGGVMWYSVPTGATHKTYVNGTSIFEVNNSGAICYGTLNATTLQQNGTPISSLFASSSSLGNYLPLSGGTMTGQLIMNNILNNPIRIQSTQVNANNCIQFQNNSTSPLGTGYIGLCGSGFTGTYANNMIIESSGGGIVLNTSGKGTSSTNPTMLLASDGTKIGMGTDAPAYSLDIHSTINNNPSAFIQLSGGGGGGNQVGIKFSAWRARSGGASASVWTIDDGNYSSHLLLGTAPEGSSGTPVLLERMRIKSNGNVGINNNNPQNLLDVNGTLNATTIQENGVPLTTKYLQTGNLTNMTTTTIVRPYPPAYLFGTTTTISNTFYGRGLYTVSSGGNFGGQEIWYAFGDPPSKNPTFGQWTSAFGNFNTSGVYSGGLTTTVDGVSKSGMPATLQLPYAVIMLSYTLTSPVTPYNNYMFRDWIFVGSNNGTTWTQLDIRTNITWSSFSTATFIFTNTTAYAYYRLIIQKTSNFNYSASYSACVCDGITFNGYEINNGISSGTVGIGTTSTDSNILSVYGNTCINGNVGIGSTNPKALLHLHDTTSRLKARIILSGQEYYTSSFSSTEGIALLCGVNRDTGDNRQLWITSSAVLGTQNTTNPVLQVTPTGIAAIATDGTTALPLNLNGSSISLANTTYINNNKSLIFDNQINDNRIQLYSGYTLGIAANTFKYISANTHAFYAGGTNTFTINGSGNVSASGEISTGSGSYLYAGGLRIGGFDTANTFYSGARNIGATFNNGYKFSVSSWGGNGEVFWVNNASVNLKYNVSLAFNVNANNTWFQFVSTAPNGVGDSFIFQHRDVGSSPTKNSYWWFNGAQSSTSSEISDQRSKRNIQDFQALDLINKLQPKTFDVIDDKDVNHQYGFIAQDIEQIPELVKLVSTTTDYVANVNSYGIHTVDENGECIITTNDDISEKINVGDELKFVSNNDTHKEFIVDATPYINRYKRRYAKITEIISSNQFKVDCDINCTTENSIFTSNDEPFLIYGKKVEDAKSLDYNSFIALNTKAIQELYTIIIKQQEQIDFLMQK